MMKMRLCVRSKLLNITAGIANPEPTAYNINYDVKLNLRNLTLSNTDAKEMDLVWMPWAKNILQKARSWQYKLGMITQLSITKNRLVLALPYFVLH